MIFYLHFANIQKKYKKPVSNDEKKKKGNWFGEVRNWGLEWLLMVQIPVPNGGG